MSVTGSVIAVVSVATAKRPPPKPIPPRPRRTGRADPSGAAKITAQNAPTPASTPRAAMRVGSMPRASQRAASAKAARAPSAQVAVSSVVDDTDRPRISPP